MGSGEEKTIMSFPRPFAYRYEDSDVWALNEMIHNLTAQPMKLDISYTVDFIPDGSPAAEGLRGVRPVWMDVENYRGYPVFDTFKGSGGGDGSPHLSRRGQGPLCERGPQRNLWTVDRDGVLVATAGHVHTGGLSTDLYLHRDGAKYAGPRCKSKPKARQRRACRKKTPRRRGRTGPPLPLGGQVLRAGRPGFMGRQHEGDARATGGSRSARGTRSRSQPTTRPRSAPGMSRWGSWSSTWPTAAAARIPTRRGSTTPGQVTHGHLPENSVHGGASDRPARPAQAPVRGEHRRPLPDQRLPATPPGTSGSPAPVAARRR